MDFIVRIVGESEENNVYTIAVADSREPDGESQSVMFQWRDDRTEQDVRLGQDTYCIVEDPGQSTQYGGVHFWGLKDRTLVIRYEVGDGDRFDLHEVDEESVKKLEAGLTRVLVGVPRDDSLVCAGGELA